MTFHRTTSENVDFQALVSRLDAYLADVNGDDHGFYDQFNGIATLNHAVVAYQKWVRAYAEIRSLCGYAR